MSEAATTIQVPRRIPCGFQVVADTREQLVYTFDALWSGPAGKSDLIDVPIIRQCLPVGDYSVLGHGGIIVERKSKADLYGSISQARENFEDRLRRMHGEYDSPWILVEAEWHELLTDPPKHTKYPPKSLSRTILAWMVRYDRVHWLMAPSRAHAEAFCFRLLERYVKENESIDRACVAAPLRPGDLAEVAGANDGIYARPGPADLPADINANVDASTSKATQARRPRAKAPTATQGELIPDATTTRAD